MKIIDTSKPKKIEGLTEKEEEFAKMVGEIRFTEIVDRVEIPITSIGGLEFFGVVPEGMRVHVTEDNQWYCWNGKQWEKEVVDLTKGGKIPEWMKNQAKQLAKEIRNEEE